jgi:hypothetical protein
MVTGGDILDNPAHMTGNPLVHQLSGRKALLFNRWLLIQHPLGLAAELTNSSLQTADHSRSPHTLPSTIQYSVDRRYVSYGAFRWGRGGHKIRQSTLRALERQGHETTGGFAPSVLLTRDAENSPSTGDSTGSQPLLDRLRPV